MKTNMSILANTSAFTGIGDPPTKATKLAAQQKVKPVGTPENDVVLDEFSNWMGKGADTKVYAADLAKRGLNNASDMILDPQKSVPAGNNLSAWKPALMQRILMNAKKKGYNQQQLLADKENILKISKGTEMVNHPLFTKDKENFWNVVGNLYKERTSAKTNPATMIALAKK